jgi:excinuclease ABC subunit B
MNHFTLQSQFSPAGDQGDAIRQLTDGIQSDNRHQILLGVTGSGKTFTVANVIEKIEMPVLVISHNKTLAAQLYQEFKEFFPYNAVEYFVSFYDYYQPEAYIPSTDTYIEKSSEINEEIDRLRLKATSSLMSRRDVIIVASVSSIYNIGSPDAYRASSIQLKTGESYDRRWIFRAFQKMQYSRNDTAFERGTFRVRGDIIDIKPAYDEHCIRIDFFGDTIESITRIHQVSGELLGQMDTVTIFPAKHFAASRDDLEEAVKDIYHELEERLDELRSENKILEAQRLEQRTLYDIEMLREVGYVNGSENYSRILDGRKPGSRPHCLIDFFEKPFLTVIDESHVTLPQIRGMYNGDRSRKSTLVEHGFRLPCALDNRPLTFDEFESMEDYVVYASATPAEYELEKCDGVIVEQVIRPTGLVDPPIEIRPAIDQVDDCIDELRKVGEKNQRALVTTLTKKMAEDLTEYLQSLDFRVRYLHSDIETIERSTILRELRQGEFDILIGINLLREGLDLPEVALVTIFDADKEGFLRSTRSLIQIAGRAARNVEGRIILYADTVTDSIARAVRESERRRTKQLAYNKKHGIIPQSIQRRIAGRLSPYREEEQAVEYSMVAETESNYTPEKRSSKKRPKSLLQRLEKEMYEASKTLDFERAARIRDQITEIREKR